MNIPDNWDRIMKKDREERRKQEAIARRKRDDLLYGTQPEPDDHSIVDIGLTYQPAPDEFYDAPKVPDYDPNAGGLY